mgnify:CR=1 FL=1
MNMSKTVNARITGTNFGIQEDGSMVFYLTLEADHKVYHVGGIALDRYDESTGCRVSFGRGMHAIRRVLETVGVSRWEDLPGSFVRVEESAWGSVVFRFGNILEDRWFDIRSFVASPAPSTRRESSLRSMLGIGG